MSSFHSLDAGKNQVLLLVYAFSNCPNCHVHFFGLTFGVGDKAGTLIEVFLQQKSYDLSMSKKNIIITILKWYGFNPATEKNKNRDRIFLDAGWAMGASIPYSIHFRIVITRGICSSLLCLLAYSSGRSRSSERPCGWGISGRSVENQQPSHRLLRRWQFSKMTAWQGWTPWHNDVKSLKSQRIAKKCNIFRSGKKNGLCFGIPLGFSTMGILEFQS